MPVTRAQARIIVRQEMAAIANASENPNHDQVLLEQIS